MSKSQYAARMKYLSNKIFGEVFRPTSSKSMKIVKELSREPRGKAEPWVKYYPRIPEINKVFNELRKVGLFRDEHRDFKEEMERLRALRGKPKRKWPLVKS